MQTLLLASAAILAALSGNPVRAGYQYGLIIVLGLAMGLQNASVRALAVPDLTTTVLTLTIVGMAADSRLAGGSGSRAGRRLIAVVAMLVGALIGSLLILHASILGSFGGGFLGTQLGHHRGRLLSVAAAVQTLLLAVAAILVTLSGNPVRAEYQYGLIIVLGLAMGLQNASARTLAVPDLTTTVLTLTIVGMAADSRLAGGSGSRAGRRLIAVVAMLVGALVGSLLILHVSIVVPLVIALVVTTLVAVTTRVLSRTDPAWVRTG